MIRVRKSNERGLGDHGWLRSRHTFSFGQYYDPQQMGFRSLRVMNEDRVAPGKGFGTHPHDNMEIISYVLDGELAHRDSMGNGSTLTPGRFQRMSAGTGVTHSEFNPSPENTAHFYQIWIEPNQQNVTPSYEELDVPTAEKRNRLRLVASPDGRDDSLTIHQDAAIYLGDLEAGKEASLPLDAGRHAWVQVLRGAATVNGEKLTAGDAAAVSEETAVAIRAEEAAEVMVFDLG
ncbi:MAG: pirin family protein [Planctomycetaceae bacterium]|nr:pirin family protein [Planctomycetaceae bacterium]